MSMNVDWLKLLRKAQIFSSFTDTHLGLIAKRLKYTSLPNGATLFKENDPGGSAFFILSGSIRLVSKEEKTLAYLNRGDIIDEMSLLSDELRQTTAVIDSTAELLVLQKTDFDHLLDKHPTLAVHLSRILSSRLASAINKNNQTRERGKTFTFFLGLSSKDQAFFAINLGISLAEQTRKKILMLSAGIDSQTLLTGLGLKEFIPSSPPLTNGIFQDQRRLDQHVLVHPSGLEILALDEISFLKEAVSQGTHFTDAIKDHYDFCLLFLPPRIDELIINITTDSDRAMAVLGHESREEDFSLLRRIDESMPAKKRLEKVWLDTKSSSHPRDWIPEFKIPWDETWGGRMMQTESAALLPPEKMGQRMFDRLARSLGELVIGFAMGSGAAHGYSLIGMLKVMEREGIFPDVISGTSMGALLGAFYAMGLSPDEIEKIACDMTQARLRRMMDLTFPRSGIFVGNGILNFLRSIIGDRTFSDLLLPFCCIAVDIMTGKEIAIEEGNVAEAVRASLSLPVFLKPHYMNGRYLVDGGLVNPVPTSHIIAQGANILISANLTSKAGERRVPRVMGWRKPLRSFLRGPNLIEILLKTIYTMQYEISAARSEIAHVVMHVNTGDYQWWDLNKAPEIIAIGAASAEENIPKMKSLLPFFANAGRTGLHRRGPKV